MLRLGEFVNKRTVVSKRFFVFALVCSVLAAFFSGYFVSRLSFMQKSYHPMGPQANVWILIETPMGSEAYLETNIITDYGENATGLGTYGTACNASWIAVGNSTIDQTKTKLDTEYARYAPDSITVWLSGGDFAINVTKKITFTETVTLNAVALHCSGTANANDAWAMSSITQTTFQANWNLTVTWIRIFNGN